MQESEVIGPSHPSASAPTVRPSCLAVIPARGGSKRVAGKNIREFAGRPVIAYTIEAALKSGLFARVIVSTDSEEIAAVATGFGAEVPFLRDSRLADDFVPVSVATKDVLERLDRAGGRFEHVCQLMPNCPLRTDSDITDSYRQLVQTGAVSQLSVVRFRWQNPWWAMKRDQDFSLVPLFEESLAARSQDLPELFCPTGAVWWAKEHTLRAHGTYHVPGRTGWEIPWTRGVDIDTEDDWAMAELLLRMQGERAD
jgi:N-acylneuraminate cytidylyltransferase